MNYLYVSLFYFYTKIVKVQKSYPPIVGISAVLSMLIILIIMILIELLNLQELYQYSNVYFMLIYVSIYILGWFLFYKWYFPKEEELLKKFKKKSNLLKSSILFFGWFFILLLIYIWFKRFEFFR